MTSPRFFAVVAVAMATAIGLAGCAIERAPVPRVAKDVLATELPLQRVSKLLTLSDEVMTDLVAAEQPGCSAAVSVRGDVLWAAAAGLADLASREPLTTESRFDMASVSKQFTATAILLLQQDGLLSLNDPVARHVDGLPRWANQVTLEQLMHHTARVPEFWRELENAGIGFSDPADHASVLAAIARDDELVEGDGYAYSNSHYVLLARVVENVSGQRFADVIEERIAEPLGLDLPLGPGLVAPDVATPYDADLAELRGGWTAYGHSGIITTPTELVRWGDQYRLGELVQGDIAAEAALVLDENDQPNGELYAAGLRIEPDGSLYHSGRWGGYLSDFTVTPDRETVIAVACNREGAPRFEIADALHELWAQRSR